jgi:hypothetical protein
MKSKGLSAALIPALVSGFLAWTPLSHAQSTRNQVLEATNTARMQSNMGRSSGYPEEQERPARSSAPVYSPSSNRNYDEREEEAALSRARRLKEAMRDATGSITSTSRNEPVSTGITDGDWQTSRLARIREGYYGERKEEPKGALSKLGSALDSISSNEEDYLRRRRAGELDEGFHPLERLSPENRSSSYKRSPDDPGLLRRLPEAAGAVTGRMGAAAGAVTGGIGAAAGKLLPDPRPAEQEAPEAEAPVRVAAQPGSEAMGPAATSESVIVGTPQPGSSSEPKHGFSMPWNRPDRSPPDLQPADTTVPEPRNQPAAKPKAEVERETPKPAAKPPEAKPNSSRVSIGGMGRNSGRGSSAPDGPLAPEQFRVVQNPSGTEFYPYDNPSPVPKVVPQGGLVEVTKPGDEWSGVVLPDGSEGIMRTAMLRRARISEMPKEAFEDPNAAAAMAPLPDSTRKPDYGGAMNVPLPDLPKPDDTSMPLGQGLLPPIQPEN